MSRRIKLVVEYDGTYFSGFQRQGKGERTVQQALESALTEVAGHCVSVTAAGRTDAGVHALGQVVHFDLSGRIPTERIATAVNGRLPRDVSISRASEAERDFHARFSAKKRTYLYLIWRAQQRSAYYGRYAWHVDGELDLSEMRGAAKVLGGVHDFAAFANAGGDPGRTTVRDLTRLDLRLLGSGKFLTIRTTANGFLRSMVRNLTGCLVDVGRRKLSVRDVERILESGSREENPSKTAPALGLCLWRVDY